MNKIQIGMRITKAVAATIVGSGTRKIVAGIIENNVPAPDKMRDKIVIAAATWVISGIVATATKKYTDEAVDSIVSAVTEVVTDIKTDAKLDRINKGTSTFEKEGLDADNFFCEDGKWKKAKIVESTTEPAKS